MSKFQKEGSQAVKELQDFARDLLKLLLRAGVKFHGPGQRTTEKLQAEQFPKLTLDRKHLNYDQPGW